MHAPHAILRSKAFRRTRWAAAAGLAAIAATATLPAPSAGAADAPVEPGQGSSIAQTWKIDPKAGGLSIGVTFGQALAGHQNTVAKAASQAINLGVVGTTLAAPGCDGSAPTLARKDQPQPLQVDSRDPGAAAGKSETEDGGLWAKKARAEATPYGEAVTTTAPFGIAGVLEVGGGVAKSTSGVVNGVRQATSTVDISGINLAGVVQLSSLHWEATYRSSGDKTVRGAFTIGHAVISGIEVPITSPSDTLQNANVALKPMGLKLVPGTARQAGGVLFVDPLAITVVPNAQRDALAAKVIGGIQPYRKSFFDAMLEYNCKFSSFITIYDILVGSITGAGEFALQLGGVQATSGEIPNSGFELQLGSFETFGGVLSSGEGESMFGTGTADIPTGPSTFSGTAPSAAPTGPRSVTRPRGTPLATSPVANAFEGSRGGAMAGVGLVTLGLLAAVAEGDRRKMRRAQREIPATEE
jgi:hypothetical protein